MFDLGGCERERERERDLDLDEFLVRELIVRLLLEGLYPSGLNRSYWRVSDFGVGCLPLVGNASQSLAECSVELHLAHIVLTLSGKIHCSVRPLRKKVCSIAASLADSNLKLR